MSQNQEIIDGPQNRLYIKEKKFMYNGLHMFLSGGNLPWIKYAEDFGNDQWSTVRDKVAEQMKQLHEAGGNCMRIWIHVGGQNTPFFDDSGYVTATDKKGTFLSEFVDMLNLAQSNDLLVIPTLWNGALDGGKTNNSKLDGLIQDTGKLESYLNVVLIPLVTIVKGHPALAGWDIINEPEGITIPGKYSKQRCYDTLALFGSGMGWAGRKFDYKDILRFINWQADAIKRVDSQALVTVGVWKPISCTDSFHLINHYADSCLLEAGGRSKGTLDFYTYHSYDFDGVFFGDAVFKHSAEDYNMEKPILVGEFWEQGGGGMTIVQMFDYIYKHRYDGAMSWDLVKFGDSQRQGVSHIQHYTGNGTIPIHIPQNRDKHKLLSEEARSDMKLDKEVQ